MCVRLQPWLQAAAQARALIREDAGGEAIQRGGANALDQREKNGNTCVLKGIFFYIFFPSYFVVREHFTFFLFPSYFVVSSKGTAQDFVAYEPHTSAYKYAVARIQ